MVKVHWSPNLLSHFTYEVSILHISYGFSSSHVWMWEWDDKAERQRTDDAFELCCCRRLECPLDCKEIQPSILKEISPGCSLERLMLKLKLQYFGHLMRRANSFEKTLMLGKIEDRRRRGKQRVKMVGWHYQLNGHGFGWTLGVGEGQRSLVCYSP